MKPKSLILLALALSCGLVASIGISQVLDRNKAEPGAPVPTQEIVVVLKDVKIGDALSAQNIKLESWPKEKVPPGAIVSLDNALNRRPRITLYAGEPIIEAKLIGADAGAAPEVPTGFRPVPVKVDEVSSSSGLILPGDTVDVLVFLTKNPSLGIYETAVRTILKKVKVFAVDQQFRREGSQEELNKARTVQLIVTPQDAELLTLAAEVSGGKIRLVLRNPNDPDQENSQGATVADFGLTGNKTTSGGGETTDPAKGKGLLDFLSGKKPEASTTAEHEAPASEEFTMLVLEGANDVREVVFSADGKIPELKSHDAASHKSGGPAAAPASDTDQH